MSFYSCAISRKFLTKIWVYFNSDFELNIIFSFLNLKLWNQTIVKNFLNKIKKTKKKPSDAYEMSSFSTLSKIFGAQMKILNLYFLSFNKCMFLCKFYTRVSVLCFSFALLNTCKKKKVWEMWRPFFSSTLQIMLLAVVT